MLSTNICHFSICFLHIQQQNGNVQRPEFVEFNRRKWNKCLRYLSQGLCGHNISPHIVFVALFSASSAKNASFFLVMNIHLRENAAKSAILRKNYNLRIISRVMQNYKVHISMEFLAVNCRHPSPECHSGQEPRRMAVLQAS